MKYRINIAFKEDRYRISFYALYNTLKECLDLLESYVDKVDAVFTIDEISEDKTYEIMLIHLFKRD